MDKCFCHLNGYAVKDATARKEIEELKKSIKDITDTFSEILKILEEI